jgi:hypothetical protein
MVPGATPVRLALKRRALGIRQRQAALLREIEAARILAAPSTQPGKMIAARQTCFCGLFRSAIAA